MTKFLLSVILKGVIQLPLEKCQVAVTDGLTLGHPRCGIHGCRNPLLNNRDQYCEAHYQQHGICAVSGCNEPVLEGRKACCIPGHQRMESLRFQKGKAAFTLKERLQRHRVSHPNTAIVTPAPAGEPEIDDDLEENETWFENDGENIELFTISDPGSVGVADVQPCEAVKSPMGNQTLKAQFGRRRTHNEQTMVRPCGIICARATFYDAEAVSNVLVR